MEDVSNLPGKVASALPLRSTRAQEVQSRRKFVFAVLSQIRQDFAAMGKSREAAPLLRQLTVLASDYESTSEMAR
jgi:hypothetical protein